MSSSKLSDGTAAAPVPDLAAANTTSSTTSDGTNDSTTATIATTPTPSELSPLKQQQQHQHQHRNADIDKALKFWTHPSLLTIPATEKMDYLKSRGFSDHDIHQVWEKMMENKNGIDYKKNQGGIDNSAETGMTITQSPSSTTANNRNVRYRDDGTTGIGREQQQLIRTATTTAPRGHADDGELMDHDASRTVAMLTVGGMLGLSAAAAVRWLNGGDFALFPPATTAGASTDFREILGAGHQNNGRDAESNDDDDSDCQSSRNSDEDDDDDMHGREAALASMNDSIRDLSRQVQELTDLVKAQNESHQRLLKSINMQHTTQVTDQSMALLRRSQPLADVKALLEQLPRDNELVQKALDVLNTHLEDNMDHQSQYQVPAISSTSNDPDLRIETESKQDTVSSISLLRKGIQRMSLETDNIADLQTGCQVLYLYVTHLSSHPHVPRYRKIFTSNDSFQKVDKLPGGMELLLAVGFLKCDGFLEWKPENEQDALKTLQIASAALALLKTASTTTTTTTNVQSLCNAALSMLPVSSSAFASPTPDFMRDESTIATTPQATVTAKTVTPTAMRDHVIPPPDTNNHPDVHSSSHPTPVGFDESLTAKDASLDSVMTIGADEDRFDSCLREK